MTSMYSTPVRPFATTTVPPSVRAVTAQKEEPNVSAVEAKMDIKMSAGVNDQDEFVLRIREKDVQMRMKSSSSTTRCDQQSTSTTTRCDQQSTSTTTRCDRQSTSAKTRCDRQSTSAKTRCDRQSTSAKTRDQRSTSIGTSSILRSDSDRRFHFPRPNYQMQVVAEAGGSRNNSYIMSPVNTVKYIREKMREDARDGLISYVKNHKSLDEMNNENISSSLESQADRCHGDDVFTNVLHSGVKRHYSRRGLLSYQKCAQSRSHTYDPLPFESKQNWMPSLKHQKRRESVISRNDQFSKCEVCANNRRFKGKKSHTDKWSHEVNDQVTCQQSIFEHSDNDLGSSSSQAGVLHREGLFVPVMPYTQLNTPVMPYTQLNTPVMPYTQLNTSVMPYTQLNTSVMPYTQLNTSVMPYTQLNMPSKDALPDVTDNRFKNCDKAASVKQQRGVSSTAIEAATAAGAGCTQDNFLTSTPVRQSHDQNGIARGIWIKMSESKQTKPSKYGSGGAQALSWGVRKSDYRAHQKSNSDDVKLHETGTVCEIAHTFANDVKSNRIFFENEVIYNVKDELKGFQDKIVSKQDGADKRHKGNATVDLIANSHNKRRQPEGQVQPAVGNKPTQLTPYWQLNISPIISKSFTDLHKRSQSEGSECTQASKSVPTTGHCPSRRTNLVPVNLFPERRTLKVCDFIITQQNYGSSHKYPGHKARSRTYTNISGKRAIQVARDSLDKREIGASMPRPAHNSRQSAEKGTELASTFKKTDLPFFLSRHARSMLGQYSTKPDPSVLNKPTELSVLNKPTEPSGLNKPNEPSGLNKLNEPSGLNKPNEPSGLNKPNEPSGLNKPNEPSGLNKPNEPSGLNKLNEPSGLNKPNEPSELNKSFEPSGLNKPNEPSGLNKSNEPSGLNKPNEPSGLYKLNGPSGLNILNEPSGLNKLNEPAGLNKLNEPSGLYKLNGPSGLNILNEPAGLNKSNEPSGLNKLNESSGLNKPNEPSGLNKLNEQAGLNKSNEPSGLNKLNEPAGLNKSNEPSGLNILNEPSGLNKPNEPSGLNKPNEPSGLNKPNEPSGLNKPNEPSGLNKLNEPSGLNKPNEPSELNKSFEPSGLNKPNELSGLNKPNEPSGLNKPNEPSGLNKPNEPSGLNKPNEPSGLNKPNEPSGLNKSNEPSGLYKLNGPSGLNKLNEPSGLYKLNGPSGLNILNEPAGLNKSNEPSGLNKLNEPSGLNKPNEPSGLNKPNEPSGLNKPNEPSGLNKPNEPSGLNKSNEPSGLYKLNGPSGLNKLNEPSGLYKLNGPSGLNILNEPAGLNKSNEPSGLNKLNEPSGLNKPNEPSGLNKLNEPAGLNKSNEPSGLNKLNEPSELNKPNELSGLNKAMVPSRLNKPVEQSGLDRQRDSLCRSFQTKCKQLSPGSRELGQGSRDRKSCLHVMCVKSADIAAIYSRLDVPQGHRSSSVATYSRDLKELLDQKGRHRTRSENLRREIGRHDQTPKENFKSPVAIDERKFENLAANFGLKQTRGKLPHSWRIQSSISRSGSQRCKFDEEEVCSSQVFVVSSGDLSSSGCSTTGSENRPQHTPVTFAHEGYNNFGTPVTCVENQCCLTSNTTRETSVQYNQGIKYTKQTFLTPDLPMIIESDLYKAGHKQKSISCHVTPRHDCLSSVRTGQTDDDSHKSIMPALFRQNAITKSFETRDTNLSETSRQSNETRNTNILSETSRQGCETRNTNNLSETSRQSNETRNTNILSETSRQSNETRNTNNLSETSRQSNETRNTNILSETSRQNCETRNTNNSPLERERREQVSSGSSLLDKKAKYLANDWKRAAGSKQRGCTFDCGIPSSNLTQNLPDVCDKDKSTANLGLDQRNQALKVSRDKEEMNVSLLKPVTASKQHYTATRRHTALGLQCHGQYLQQSIEPVCEGMTLSHTKSQQNDVRDIMKLSVSWANKLHFAETKVSSIEGTIPENQNEDVVCSQQHSGLPWKFLYVGKLGRSQGDLMNRREIVTGSGMKDNPDFFQHHLEGSGSRNIETLSFYSRSVGSPDNVNNLRQQCPTSEPAVNVTHDRRSITTSNTSTSVNTSSDVQQLASQPLARNEALAAPWLPTHVMLIAPSDTDCTDQISTSGDLVTMNRTKGPSARNRNIFKGSVFISLLVETYPKHFPSRSSACRLGRRLFREGYIESIVGVNDFEDSAQLYMWHDEGITQQIHAQYMTSAVSSSHSNTNTTSSPEKNHRHLDWQLIQDIRNKLLSRTEAYNIVTSYNTFFQELQQDFGYIPNSDSQKKDSQKKSPVPGGDIAWTGGNTPHTSTLELKKGASSSTNNNLNHQDGFQNVADGATCTKSNSKHSFSNPHFKRSVTKDISTFLPHESSQDIVHNQKNIQPRNQRQQHRHHNSKQHHNKTSAHTTNKKQSVSMNSRYHVNHGERLTSAVLSQDQPNLSTPSPTVMDYRDDSNQLGAPLTSQKSSVAVDGTENKSTRNAESNSELVGGRRNRWSQEPLIQQVPPVPLEMQTWLNSGLSHLNGSQRWVSENMRSENEGGSVGAISSRWPDGVVSDGIDGGRRWPETTCSYSDNEKQLLEEMRRMKKEHQNVLRTYEGRINKLMTKMHELRNIAEMLEHSSNKSSPYGVLPGKLALMNIWGRKSGNGKSAVVDPGASEVDLVPPPLPPRPGRGSRVYPNKPIIHTSVAMKPLLWSRIILENDTRGEQTPTIWLGMSEPKMDTGELQKLFSGSHDSPSDVNLYDDVSLRRGRSQSQLVSIYDAERSQRITSELQALHCALPDVIQAFLTLNCDGIHTESFAELLELLMSPRDLDKISQHVKTRGAGQLDVPEYLVFELSKVDHFRERLEFLRFKNKIQINLFEIDQQLRELQTACEEITSSISLKHVLETVLAVGNLMNAGTDRGQADGFKVDILTSLKDIQDLSKQCNLLELVMRMYCLKFESDLDFGCPTRFRLPEPSNMRHAAQVSFDDIQRALKELKDELSIVKNKLESLSKREGSTLTLALKVTSENFMTSAVEVLVDEQKLLEDTRAQFWKTASYFSYDGQKSTPREFFQIWASFLHDCKYYWKLAHRNLAKAKFNTDLITKSQLSCSSLPGFNSLKSAMMKHVASFQQDEEIRTAKTQQLQHVTSWIQSLGKYTMEMQPDCEDLSLDGFVNQSLALPGLGQQKQQSQRGQDHGEGSSSPPYKNQTVPETSDFVDSLADLGKQFEQRNKSKTDNVRTKPSKSSRHSEQPQDSFPPKFMKSTPPNVIKPQPTVLTFNSTSSDQNIPKPLTPASCQTTVPEMKDNHRHIIDHEEQEPPNFEPLYESLSHYSQNFLDTQSKDVSTKSHTDEAVIASPSNTLSSDPDSSHRKNAKFFKSLLKRDQKRPPVHEDSPANTQAALFKSTSTPFSKVKNSFVQKFSASGNNKNSNNDSQKDYNHSNLNPLLEAHGRKIQGPSLEHTPLFYTLPNRETVLFNSSRGGVTEAHHVNYQNLCFPYHPRPTESFRQTPTPNCLDVDPHHNEQTFYGGHESFPSTVSSLQSIRNRSRSRYQGNILQRQDDITAQQKTFSKTSREDNHVSHEAISGSMNDNIRTASQSSQARVRAAIALGSNISISDVYGKGTENAETQTSGSYDYQFTGSNDLNQEKDGSNNNAAAKSAGPDPKWVKASPVPVYKAKLIPNYENQSKYDPRFEGGVRGRAEAVAMPAHVPQVSISSDLYRQELQKKSEQYIGGSIYPTSLQVQTSSNNLKGFSSLGTSCSILPSKPNHYHAFPITISQEIQQVNSSPVTSYSRTSNISSQISQNTDSQQKNEIKNNPENGEIVLSTDFAPQQRLDKDSSQINFFGSSERKQEMTTSCNALPVGNDKGRTVQGEHYFVYRSSSAHSILDRDSEFRRRDMGVHSMHARPESQEYKSHVSRKNLGGKKVTPTSRRDNSEIKKSDVPQSVTSLINKFEKGTDVNNLNLGLLDISDKPPSMTSTPVVRRRNQGVSTIQPSQGKLTSVTSESESSRSFFEGARRSLFPKETLIPGWQRDTMMEELASPANLAPHDNHFSGQHHEMVDQQLQHGDKTSRSKQGSTKQSEDFKGHHQSDQNPSPGESYIVKYSGNQNQQTFSQYGLSNHQQPDSDIDRMFGTAFNSQLQSDVPRNSHNCQNQISGHLSKPQNSHLHLPEASRQQQHTENCLDSVTTSHVTLDPPQQQTQTATLPGYDNLPLQRQLVSATHNPHLNSQVQVTQSFGSMNSTSSTSYQRGKPNEDFHYSSKPSAFEPLARGGPVYGRQPGTMAVVKPTVMNI